LYRHQLFKGGLQTNALEQQQNTHIVPQVCSYW